MRYFKYDHIKEPKLTDLKQSMKMISHQIPIINSDRNYKMNEIETKGLESRISEMKNSLEGLDNKLSRHKKESMNLKIGQLRYLNLRSRKKKNK